METGKEKAWTDRLEWENEPEEPCECISSHKGHFYCDCDCHYTKEDAEAEKADQRFKEER